MTTTHIISEVAHRLMTIEAMQTHGWKSAGIAMRLRNHPAEVQALSRYRQAVQEIQLFNIRILLIETAWLDAATAVSQQTGLLHNDALTIAAMQSHGLTNLASADPDFARVPGITLRTGVNPGLRMQPCCGTTSTTKSSRGRRRERGSRATRRAGRRAKEVVCQRAVVLCRLGPGLPSASRGRLSPHFPTIGEK